MWYSTQWYLKGMRITFKLVRSQPSYIIEKDRLRAKSSIGSSSALKLAIHIFLKIKIVIPVWTQKDVMYIVYPFFSAARLELFGSSNNGFGFRHSDLDLCMTFSDLPVPEVNLTHVFYPCHAVNMTMYHMGSFKTFWFILLPHFFNWKH